MHPMLNLRMDYMIIVTTVIPLGIANILCGRLPWVTYWTSYFKSLVLLMQSFCDTYNYSSNFMDGDIET